MKLRPRHRVVRVMKLEWFARCKGIKKMGPYASQLEATNALRLGVDSGQLFPEDAFVWPEPAERQPPRARNDH